jgi:chorismate mutase / prephenate dehydratase
MAMDGKRSADPAKLAELRAKIDAIDESVHRLLMQRATVIDELIAAKGPAATGAAFRPAREADMMRRLAARHAGHLPLTAVEHLWREIISTFTALQAPFEVLASTGPDPVAAVEAARFTCGFSVPVHLRARGSQVIDAMAGRTDRLGIVLLDETAEPWWDGLGEIGIVARLPFFEVPSREAGAPALLLSPPLADPVPFEVECFVVPDGHLPDGAELLARAEGRSALVGAPAGRLAAGDLDIRPVGGYAAPLRA